MLFVPGQLSLIFLTKSWVEPLPLFNCTITLLTLTADAGLSSKGMSRTNSLAYLVVALVTKQKHLYYLQGSAL